MGYVYSTPDYLGCTNYVELDRDISELHLNSVKTGLLPSFMLSFNNGVPSDEERIQLEQAVYDKFGGAKNAGKIMITYNDNKEDASVIEPFNIPDVHKQFDLAKQCFQEILSGHVTSPLLFGLRSEGGGFGSNADEMRDAYELYLNTVVQPMQDVIIDALRLYLARVTLRFSSNLDGLYLLRSCTQRTLATSTKCKKMHRTTVRRLQVR